MISGTRCSKSSTTAERKSCFPTKVRPAVLNRIATEAHVKRDSGGAICAARGRLCPLMSVNVRFPSRARQACALQQTFALTPHAECKYCLSTQIFPLCSPVSASYSTPFIPVRSRCLLLKNGQNTSKNNKIAGFFNFKFAILKKCGNLKPCRQSSRCSR